MKLKLTFTECFFPLPHHHNHNEKNEKYILNDIFKNDFSYNCNQFFKL